MSTMIKTRRHRRLVEHNMWQHPAALAVVIALLSAPQVVQAQRRQTQETEGYKAEAEASVERPAPAVTEAPTAVITPIVKASGSAARPQQTAAAAPPPEQNDLLLRNETIAFEDFEEGNNHTWSDQRVSESPMFTTFLGRFGQEDDGSNAFTTTSKTYTVPETAEHIGIEFDFFELDLWCDCDHLTVMICGEDIDMGEFSQIAPDNQNGVSQNGIPWWRNATSRNVDMGYASYRDATHRMGLDIPQDCYIDGTLELKFNVTTNGGFDLVSGGIDNIKIIGYNIPPKVTEMPSMAPTEMQSEPPTADLGLDICISDVEYDPDVGTVHRDCFDMVARITDAAQGTPEEHVVGEACVEAIDNNNFQLNLKQRGPKWSFSKASAWTGESLDDVPRLTNSTNSTSIDYDAFESSRRWSESDGVNWITTLPLVHTYGHCASGLDEFTELLIVHVEGKGPDPANENDTVTFQAQADEHYNQTDDFLWTHLVFSCHCNHDVKVDPPPTVTPSIAPSAAQKGLPTTSPSMVATTAPTMLTSTVGTEACIATDDGSGRQCRPLVGKDGTHFGEVCIEMANAEDTAEKSNNVLNVTYTTREDYRLTRNFLWLGDKDGSKVPTKSKESRELDNGEEPDVEQFPHFSCNYLGSKIWEKLITLQPGCQDSGDRIIPLSIVAHSEIAVSESDGTVALGTIGAKAFGAERTIGSINDASWYEIIHFKIDCDCQYIRYNDRNTTYEPYVGVPTTAPSASPIGNPTKFPSPGPTIAPTLLLTEVPSSSPSSHAPTPAPTYACRPAWAIEQMRSYCFRDILELGRQSAPYGWYNGLIHLDEVVTMDLFVEQDTSNTTCEYGERVGTVDFRYDKKVVTVEFETVDEFYMTETQVHVGAEILPLRDSDQTYITDPAKFELVNDPSGRTIDDHFLRGCAEDNWISARALVCGPFQDDLNTP